MFCTCGLDSAEGIFIVPKRKNNAIETTARRYHENSAHNEIFKLKFQTHSLIVRFAWYFFFLCLGEQLWVAKVRSTANRKCSFWLCSAAFSIRTKSRFDEIQRTHFKHLIFEASTKMSNWRIREQVCDRSSHRSSAVWRDKRVEWPLEHLQVRWTHALSNLGKQVFGN